MAALLSRLAVPAIVGLGLVQSSIYDVPGGHRAVIFDRFSGVRDKVIYSVFILELIRWIGAREVDGRERMLS